LYLLVSVAWAQAVPAPQAAVDPAEFQRIEATRASESAALDAEESACYQRFAVSGCLKGVQSRRRAMLAGLRRQEAVLHEREFAERAAEQRARNLQKIAERKQQEEGQRSGDAEAEQREKLQAQKDKQADHATKARQPQASAPPAPHTSGPTPAEQAANRDSYARKQADAQKKREEIARRQSKSVAPLPLPK
jgi:hypothetical protein